MYHFLNKGDITSQQLRTINNHDNIKNLRKNTGKKNLLI